MYAKAVMTDVDKKNQYAAIAPPGTTAFNMAVADYLKLPEITEVDGAAYTGLVGSKIRIRALDNFKITQVAVVIKKADNTIVESARVICH